MFFKKVTAYLKDFFITNLTLLQRPNNENQSFSLIVSTSCLYTCEHVKQSEICDPQGRNQHNLHIKQTKPK